MKKMLITGGTVFVSKFAAEYYRDKYDVYVLNRNTRKQCEGVTLIEGDRHILGDILRGTYFDIVLDITAYNQRDVDSLLDALDGFGQYILLSSSAVYPESEAQPFGESAITGENIFWGNYGIGKIAAENTLLTRVPKAYILRPPYLYGPGNNVYREAFVFDCGMRDRPFYLPGKGEMKLQFFHVRDLFRFVDVILEKRPQQHIFNVGNLETVSVKEWVTICYQLLGKTPKFISAGNEIEQRSFFPFYDYEYSLDVSRQLGLFTDTISLTDGLREALYWYLENREEVRRKPLLEFIDENLKVK